MVIALFALVSISVYAHPHSVPTGVPVTYTPPKLTPGQSLGGLQRAELRVVDEGPFGESPALAVLPDGRAAVAWVQFEAEGHREKLLLKVETAPGTWGDTQTVSEGPRTWRPVLSLGAEGRLWAVWCGTDKFPERGNHERSVWMRALLPKLGEVQRLSGTLGRNCDPAVAHRTDGSFAVAWESSDLRDTDSRIAWRVFNAQGQPAGAVVQGKAGWLDRRPTLVATASGWLLGWDRWLDRGPSGQDDPDYDVYGLSMDARGRAGTETRWAGGEGIQAAPSLAGVDADTAALVFHSSAGHSLVRHTQLAVLRRGAGGWTASLPAHLHNRWAETDSRGEQQGSEFPDLLYSSARGLVFTSRPSQGFFLHRLEGDTVYTWDLTTQGWSARGIHAALAWGPAGELWVARRGARAVVVEKLQLPEFKGTLEVLKKWKQALPASNPGTKAKARVAPVVPGGGRLKVYYGDVHMHSGISDAAGAPDEVIARAYARGLDFATLTDHDRVGGGNMIPSEYAEIAWLTDLFDRLRDFTALHAYEWTTVLLPQGSGHRNIYFQGYGPDEVYSKVNGRGDTRTLFDALRSEKAFAVPHHTTWTGTDWENHDEAIQRHVEVVSVHGASDEPEGPVESRGEMPGMFIVDGLKRGLHFGLIAGSDGHGLIYHHGIARHRDPWAHAVTGVLATEASRETLWKAMFERHTFGTSGPRSQIFLRAGDHARQGDRVVGAPPWMFHVDAKTVGVITEAALFRNGEKWKVLEIPAGVKELHLKVEDAPAVEEGGSKDFSYFLRVTEKTPERVEAGWSSPIFLQAD